MVDKARSNLSPDASAKPRLTAESVARSLVVLEKRRLERLAQAHGVSRKVAAKIANAFFSDVIHQSS